MEVVILSNTVFSLLRIERSAFEDCYSLKEITIPDKVDYIGYGAFANCLSLVSVKLPTQLHEITGGLFYGCTSLENVTVSPELTVIQANAFINCTALKELALPETVTELGMEFIAGCPITQFNIPSGVDTLWHTFADCKELRNIIVPSSVTRIEEEAFKNCEKMSWIYIPDSVTYITYLGDAFENCYFLVINAPKGSYAIEYAKEHNMKYVEIDQKEDGESFDGIKMR